MSKKPHSNYKKTKTCLQQTLNKGGIPIQVKSSKAPQIHFTRDKIYLPTVSGSLWVFRLTLPINCLIDCCLMSSCTYHAYSRWKQVNKNQYVRKRPVRGELLDWHWNICVMDSGGKKPCNSAPTDHSKSAVKRGL